MFATCTDDSVGINDVSDLYYMFIPFLVCDAPSRPPAVALSLTAKARN